MSKRQKQSICHCINLRRAAAAVTDYYDRKLQPLGLTINQYSLLINVKRLQPVSVSLLASQVGLDRTTLARSLKPLFDGGLMVDTAQAKQRNRQLQLTEHGSNTLKAALPLWEKAQSDIELTLGQSNLKKMNYLLFKLESL